MGATGLWALMVVGAAVVLGLIGLAVVAERPEARPDDAAAEAAELAVHSAAVQVEAGRAATAAIQARAAAVAAERARDEAWTEQTAAERSYERAYRAALDGRRDPARPAAPGEREQTVSRAALSAYRRGDISVEELRTVWQRAGDWDPGQEERERAAERLRLAQAAARRAHDRAAAEARRAQQAARVAEVAAQAMVDEAAESAVEAQRAQDALAALTRRRRGRLPRRRSRG